MKLSDNISMFKVFLVLPAFEESTCFRSDTFIMYIHHEHRVFLPILLHLHYFRIFGYVVFCFLQLKLLL